MEKETHEDIEEGSSESSCISDGEDHSCNEHRLSRVSDTMIDRVSDINNESSVSDRFDEMDLESGISEIKDNTVKDERDCRICHLGLENNPESGIPIELGCSCKDDLAAAHKQCAETWFKIKGNKTCEICGARARNVVGLNENEFSDQWNSTEINHTTLATPPTDIRSFWQGRRFLNILLACMVFAFVISWLFHFNVPS